MKKRKPRFINPINFYTGEVSVLTIAKNIQNGHTKFPKNMGVTIRKASK